MDDAFFMCGLKSITDLAGDRQRLLDCHGSGFDPVGERRAFDQFHDQVVGADIVELADVAVIQRGNRARLAVETGVKLLVGELDGDGPSEARVDSAKNFAHSAFAELLFNTVWA